MRGLGDYNGYDSGFGRMNRCYNADILAVEVGQTTPRALDLLLDAYCSMGAGMIDLTTPATRPPQQRAKHQQEPSIRTAVV
jgi:hypothetical protein